MGYPTKHLQQSFTVPVTSGNYATEILYTNITGAVAAGQNLDWLDKLILVVSAITATAQVEVDLLRPGFDPNGGDASFYLLAVAAITTVGYKGNVLGSVGGAGWWGARVRVKSGGTAGTTVLGAAWGSL